MRPTHVLTAKAVDGSQRGVVGAAWEQADGSFYVKLNACVVLDWRDGVTIRLFPVDEAAAAEDEVGNVVRLDPKRRRKVAPRTVPDGPPMSTPSRSLSEFISGRRPGGRAEDEGP